jgi:hypothetical protein
VPSANRRQPYKLAKKRQPVAIKLCRHRLHRCAPFDLENTMFLACYELGLQTMLLAIEAQSVIGLRLTKLAHGGCAARTEAYGMVAEKTDAMAEALGTLACGGSIRAVICRFRTQVRANEERLLSAG